MSCYFRHIKDILDELDVEISSENKKDIDRMLHGIAGVTYKDCPSTWKKIKEMVKGGEAQRKRFVEVLKKEMRKTETKD